jgi:transposase-like protein
MMAERGIALEHNCDSALDTTVPEFEKRWSQYSRSVGKSWLCDETDIKVKGHWT